LRNFERRTLNAEDALKFSTRFEESSPADWQSAIQQAGSLRYENGGFPQSTLNIEGWQGFTGEAH
jgi:hypothetical protein